MHKHYKKIRDLQNEAEAHKIHNPIYNDKNGTKRT